MIFNLVLGSLLSFLMKKESPSPHTDTLQQRLAKFHSIKTARETTAVKSFGKKFDMNIPTFGNIEFELLAKATALKVAVPGEVADDVGDVMVRASVIIGAAILALNEIRKIGVNTEGHMSPAAIRADEILMLIRENTK
jgi:hypothetical protein